MRAASTIQKRYPLQFLTNFIESFQLSGFRAKRGEFYEQLAQAIVQKETLKEFLTEERKISRNSRTRDKSRDYALTLMLRRVETGSMTRFSQIFQGIVPDNDRMMLSAVDDAADKPAIFRSISESIRQQNEMISMVRSKVIPPMAILPGAFCYAYVMATQSLPIIVKIAPPEVWNTFNSSVRNFSEFIVSAAPILIPLLIVGGFIFTRQLSRWVGSFRSRIESIDPRIATGLFVVAPWMLPTVVYRDLMAGRLFTVLAVLLRAGRTLNDALLTIRSHSNPWMRWHINKILRHLETSPTEYAKAFGKGLLSPALLARLSSQIRTAARFEDVLIKLGSSGSIEVKKVVEVQMSIINKVMMVLAGGLVVFMLLGQLLISNSLREELSPGRVAARQEAMRQGH